MIGKVHTDYVILSIQDDPEVIKQVVNEISEALKKESLFKTIGFDLDLDFE